jgi:hypothetical protein
MPENESIAMSLFMLSASHLRFHRALHKTISQSNEPAPLHHAKATRLSNRMEFVMKFFSRLFTRREGNLTTALERQRLGRTMPGQTGAVAAARLGFVA